MPTHVPVQTVTVPGSRRALASLIWVLLQAVVICALVLAGGVAAASVDRAVTGRAPAGAPAVLTGLAAGALIGLFAVHQARRWLQELRLRRLRAAGVRVRATVDRLDRQHLASSRGPGLTSYVVHLHWQDPDSGARCQGERRYRFSGRGSRRLEALCAAQARLAVYYPARRPPRFVIDVPFTPTRPDFFG